MSLADGVLFPAAPATDRAPRVPPGNLDALAAAGLYGLVGSATYGGLGAGTDPATVGAVVEALASGCLSSTLVWAQHHSLVKALMTPGAPRELRAHWLGPLCRGDRRAGVALGGVLPGPPRLLARPADGGWTLVGSSPWVSGWGMVDVVYVGARHPDGDAVWLVVDAVEGQGLSATRHRLAALDASSTVEVEFDGTFVDGARTVAMSAYSEDSYSGVERLRFNGYLALGVARRCLLLLGESATGEMIEELDRRRSDLFNADEGSIAPARAAAAYFAWRLASALVVHTGSRSLLIDEHAQRLVREAMFLLVFGTRPPIRDELLARFLRG